MADQLGQAEIRGLDINKLATGFRDEANVLRKFVRNTKTTSEQFRWYSKSTGYLDSADSTNSTKSLIRNVAPGSLPVVVNQSWTRNTGNVVKFFASSPLITLEDIKGSDLDVLGTMVKDVVACVNRKVDERIYKTLIEAAEATPTTPNPSTVNTAAAVGAGGWNSAATGDPIQDILAGLEAIRSYSYDTKGCVLFMNQAEHKWLMVNLISVKGSSIPSFSSEQVKKQVVMEILGCQVVVSTHATTDNVLMFVPNVAATYREFMSLSSAVVNEPGIGKTIRCWSEGECTLDNPRAVHIITNTIV